MTALEAAMLIFASPIAIGIGAYLGRKAQRWYWDLDLPYEERLKRIGR